MNKTDKKISPASERFTDGGATAIIERVGEDGQTYQVQLDEPTNDKEENQDNLTPEPKSR